MCKVCLCRHCGFVKDVVQPGLNISAVGSFLDEIRLNYKNFHEPLTFHVAPPSGQYFYFSNVLV